MGSVKPKPTTFFGGALALALILGSTSCSTVSSQTIRYEIQVPLDKTEESTDALVKRETILRSAIADFDGIMIEQYATTSVKRGEGGGVQGKRYWKIIFEASGSGSSDKVVVLLKQVEDAFGTSDVSVVRYPVER